MIHLNEGKGWSEGANNRYPTSIRGISSFDAIDAAIAYFADKERFPMIEHVVLAGHGAGARSKQVHAIRIQVSD